MLAAAVGPLALAAANARPAPAVAGDPAASAGSLFALLAGPLLVLAGLVAAGLLFVLAVDVVRLRRVKRAAVPLGIVAVRRARVGTSPTVATPTAIGYLHPAVVLPEGFRDRVDAREWDAVLAHECAHLARGDDWHKAFQSAVLRAGWWIPGLWILSRALDLERELASDERAAGETGARRYAACLLRLATSRGTDAVAPALWGRRSHVAIRVERLLRPVTAAAPVVRAGALGAFTALTIAVLCAAVLAVPGTVARPVAAVVAPYPAAVRTLAAARPALHRSVHALAAHARRPAIAPRVVSFAGTAATRAAASAVEPSAGAAPAPAAAAAAPRAAAEASAPVAAAAVRPAPAPAPARARSTGLTVAQAAPTADRTTEERSIPSRPAPIRANVSDQMLAYAAAPPPHRCATCFGPLRSPDVAVPTPPPAFVPAGGGGGGSGASAIAAGDAGFGPLDLNAGLIWYRSPARIIQLP